MQRMSGRAIWLMCRNWGFEIGAIRITSNSCGRNANIRNYNVVDKMDRDISWGLKFYFLKKLWKYRIKNEKKYYKN